MIPNGRSGSMARPVHDSPSPRRSSNAIVVPDSGRSPMIATQRRSRLAAPTWLDELGLRDRGDALRVIDEPPDLGRGRSCVGGDGHRAQRRARQPREQHLGAVVGVDQDLVAELDPSVAQPGREVAGGGDELRVGPTRAVALERLPDQRRMIGLLVGPVLQEPGDVLPVHLQFVDCRTVHSLPSSRLIRAPRNGGQSLALNDRRAGPKGGPSSSFAHVSLTGRTLRVGQGGAMRIRLARFGCRR